jgi:hypothetical protein
LEISIDETEMMAMHASSPNGFLIAIIVGVVVIAMFKSRRSPSGRVGPGWWFGLVILLLGLSIGFGFTTWSSRGGYEERVATVPTVIKMTAEARREIQAGTQQLKDSLREAKDQLQQALDFSSDNHENNGSKARIVSHPPSPPTPPRGPQTLMVVGDQNGSKDEQYVRRSVIEKAVREIDEWVAKQLPTKAYYSWHNRDPAKLGLSPKKVDLAEQEVNLPDGKKETLYTGSYQVALTPQMQEDLLSAAYSDMEQGLATETLEIQGIFAIVIAGITILAALLGLYRYYVCWSRSKLAALQAAPSN